MQRYCIGIIEDKWQNALPPIQRKPLRSNNTDKNINHDRSLNAEASKVLDSDPEKADEIVTKFRLLISKLEAEGLYECNYYKAYATEAIRCTVLFVLMLVFLRSGWYAISAAFLGCFWHQIVASAHDAGHLAVTKSYNTDTIIGTLILNYMGGLSMGWWKRNHNIHHIVTNSPSHDQDIQILPFIAISPELFDSIYSTASECIMHYNKLAQLLVPHQAWLYYFLLSVGRFNLYYLAWDFILRDLGTKLHRWLRLFELAGQIFFWTWFGYFLVYCSIPTVSQRVVFILISHMITLPLHLQLTISHFSMSTAESVPSETWPQRAFRTTMDIDCAPWMDWFHGGLQFLVTHHLFPRMPRHNLRKASGYVKDFCADTGLKYEVYGLGEGNGRLYKRLAEVARQATYLKDCQDSVVQKGDYLHGHWD
jgi:delta8-fatty-acid desaturase